MSILLGSTVEQPLIIDILERSGKFTEEKVNAARAVLTEGGSPERDLIQAGFVTDQEIAHFYAEDLYLPLLGLEDILPGNEEDLRKLFPEKLCQDRTMVPIAHREEEEILDVAFMSPDDMAVVDELQLLTGLRIRPMIAPLSIIQSRIEALYYSEQAAGGIQSGGEYMEPENTDEEDDDADEGILQLDAPPPPGENGRIVRMVNQLLDQAVRLGASDIHLEPFEDSCKFRLRIDGVLHELPPPSKTLFIMTISRLKILAKMDIAEKRIPQDGSIAVKTKEKRIDLRVNTVPTVYGEKMVMRILDKGAIPLELTGLGLDERQSTDLIESITMPHGLALVTGPTGSGKSTTLYSCLNLLNSPEHNICTVEDPVEYKFKGLNQVQVKTQVGLTFSSALRAFLRQDPDVIMVGEVRDQETAEICLRAALTGHFVLSTLHTNDALAAVTRLQDMGIEPFLLSCTLRVLEAQRLVRKLCQTCKEAYTIEAEVAERHGLIKGETIFKPKGCPQCRFRGYKGRVGVFEVVRITQRLQKMIQTRASLNDLRKAAREEGMKLLYDSAIDKVRSGFTSLESALSVTMGEDE